MDDYSLTLIVNIHSWAGITLKKIHVIEELQKIPTVSEIHDYHGRK